jgi:hypothetical protein
MVMPNLWTFGQVDYEYDIYNGDDGNGRPSIRRRIRSLAQVHGPAFLLGCILVDALCFGCALWKFKQVKDSIILPKAFGLSYVLYRLLLSAVGVFAGLSSGLQIPSAPVRKMVKSLIPGSVIGTALKMNALKIAVAMLQIPLWNNLMERSNRRWLWSKERFATTVTTAAMGGLTIFGILLFR